MKRHVIILFSLVFGGPTFAEVCPEIENDLDRLACYDEQSGRSAKVEISSSAESAWSVRSEKSDFKDTTDVYLTNQSLEPLSCNMLGQAESATLIVRCMENTTSLFVSTNCHLASGFQGYGQVDYRVDDQPTRTKEFDASTDNSALGLWNGTRAIPVLKEMLDGNSMMVRFTPFSGNATTAKFDISGMVSAVEPLREACGW